jgi:hypothetical protein
LDLPFSGAVLKPSHLWWSMYIVWKHTLSHQSIMSPTSYSRISYHDGNYLNNRFESTDGKVGQGCWRLCYSNCS